MRQNVHGKIRDQPKGSMYARSGKRGMSHNNHFNFPDPTMCRFTKISNSNVFLIIQVFSHFIRQTKITRQQKMIPEFKKPIFLQRFEHVQVHATFPFNPSFIVKSNKIVKKSR